MTYDYAKLETLSAQRGARKGLYIGIFVVIIFSILGIGYLYSAEKTEKPILVAEHTPDNTPAEKTTPLIPEPEFAFYTILPNTETKPQSSKNMQLAASQPAHTKAATNQHPALLKGKTYVQVASYRENSDADKLKAHLSLLGFDCQVRLGKTDDPVHYRVLIGPFSNEKEALDAQETLTEHHFNRGMVLKMPA